jgi:hypothetical protein
MENGHQDVVSFEIMRQLGLDTAFTFALHFHEQGFKVIPQMDLR